VCGIGHTSYSHFSPSICTPSYSPADSFSESATTIFLPMPARFMANASRSALNVFPEPDSPSMLIFNGRRCRFALRTSNMMAGLHGSGEQERRYSRHRRGARDRVICSSVQ
jgi:hypothetical protein